MSETSKRNISSIVWNLNSARGQINEAVITAAGINDKVLSDKIDSAAKSLKDVSDYVKSRTGEGA